MTSMENSSNLKSRDAKHYLKKQFMLTLMRLKMKNLIDNLSGTIKVMKLDEKAALRYAGLAVRVKLTLKPVVDRI